MSRRYPKGISTEEIHLQEVQNQYWINNMTSLHMLTQLFNKMNTDKYQYLKSITWITKRIFIFSFEQSTFITWRYPINTQSETATSSTQPPPRCKQRMPLNSQLKVKCNEELTRKFFYALLCGLRSKMTEACLTLLRNNSSDWWFWVAGFQTKAFAASCNLKHASKSTKKTNAKNLMQYFRQKKTQ